MTNPGRDHDLALRINSIALKHGGALIDRPAMCADLRGLIAWDRAQRAEMIEPLIMRIVEVVIAIGELPESSLLPDCDDLVARVIREHLADAMPGEREA